MLFHESNSIQGGEKSVSIQYRFIKYYCTDVSEIKAKKFVLTCENVRMHFWRKNKQTIQKKVYPLSFSSFFVLFLSSIILEPFAFEVMKNSQKEK